MAMTLYHVAWCPDCEEVRRKLAHSYAPLDNLPFAATDVNGAIRFPDIAHVEIQLGRKAPIQAQLL